MELNILISAWQQRQPSPRYTPHGQPLYLNGQTTWPSPTRPSRTGPLARGHEEDLRPSNAPTRPGCGPQRWLGRRVGATREHMWGTEGRRAYAYARGLTWIRTDLQAYTPSVAYVHWFIAVSEFRSNARWVIATRGSVAAHRPPSLPPALPPSSSCSSPLKAPPSVECNFVKPLLNPQQTSIHELPFNYGTKGACAALRPAARAEATNTSRASER